jgi:hypothetical protein
VNVTLCPGASFQPVTGIGCCAFGFVAAQIVWLYALTMVIRWSPAGAVVCCGASAGFVGVPARDFDALGEADGDGEAEADVEALALAVADPDAFATAPAETELVADDVATDPAALRVPPGDPKVSQSTVSSATVSASPAVTPLRRVHRNPRGLRLLCSMSLSHAPKNVSVKAPSTQETGAARADYEKRAATLI